MHRRARIFEFRPPSHSVASDVSCPAGSMGHHRYDRHHAWCGLMVVCMTTCSFSYKTATCVYTNDTIQTVHVLVRSRFDRVYYGLHVSMHVGARPKDCVLSLQMVKCAWISIG